MSDHDIERIRIALIRGRSELFDTDEIIASSRRVPDGLRLFGIPVRTNDDLGLNEVLLVQQDKEPRLVDLEADDA